MDTAHVVSLVLVLLGVCFGVGCAIGWAGHASFAARYHTDRSMTVALESVDARRVQSPVGSQISGAPTVVHVHLHSTASQDMREPVIDGEIVRALPAGIW